MVSQNSLLLVVAVLLGLVSSSVYAAETLEETVQKAIANNPEVSASWHAFKESVHEQKAAKGGFLPSINLDARAGHEDVERPLGDDSYQPLEASLSLKQLVFDGFATSSEVKRLGFSKLVRYNELLQASENTALEAVTAYVDVMRFRQLLSYADENFYQHEQIFQQVKERVESGLGRGVDLEQATGRLALANSNRITEANNLHDVTARYLRIVGELPATELAQLPTLRPDGFPADMEAALKSALNFNPAFNTAIENVRAAGMARDARKSGYWPKMEFRANYDTGDDRDQIDGHSEESVVELALTYNLFRGGSDLETVRQYTSRLNRARNLREKSCRDVRQTMTIAYNEISLLEKQLNYLKSHMDSIANARHAYRKQFDLGQRTLLDLLDAENEFFRARRAYTLATFDYKLAHAKTLAGMGQLLTTMGARRDGMPTLGELGVETHKVDPLSICPASAVPESLYSTAASDFSNVSAMISTELERDVDYDGDGVLVSQDKCPGTASGVTVDDDGCPEKLKKYVSVADSAATDVDSLRKKITGANRLVKKVEIFFPVGKARVPEGSNTEILEMAKVLKKYPEASLILGGHTDSTGTGVYNLNLSRNRAEAVRNKLIYSHGIDADRIFMTWYNSDRPIADNATAEGRQQNRRVESYISLVLKGVDLDK